MCQNYKFNFKRELDTTELIKGGFALIGAIIIFCLITSVLKDVEIKKVQLELAKEFPNLIPSLKNNYTNQLSKDGDELTVLVVLRNKSTLPVEIESPEITIYDANNRNITNAVKSSDIDQFNGILSPASEYRITYNVLLNNSINTIDHKIELVYKAKLPKSLSNIYKQVYDDIPETEWGKVESAWSVDYKYKEQIYLINNNSIWKDWWLNPR